MHILNIEAISTDINIHCSHMTTSQMIIHRCSIEVYNDFASGLSVSRVTSLFLTLQYIFFCHSCPLFLLFSLALFPSFCPSCAAGGCWQKTGEKCSTLTHIKASKPSPPKSVTKSAAPSAHSLAYLVLQWYGDTEGSLYPSPQTLLPQSAARSFHTESRGTQLALRHDSAHAQWWFYCRAPQHVSGTVVCSRVPSQLMPRVKAEKEMF